MRHSSIICALQMLALAITCAPGANANQPAPDATSTQPLISIDTDEKVLIAEDPCGIMAVPDSPARAMRLPDGRLYLLASHHNNVPAIGDTFASAVLQCETAGGGLKSADPYAFDDLFWVQAIAPGDNGSIVGIASHDYNGRRHEGTCRSDRPGGCWYSSILLAIADSPEQPFKLLPMPERLIAVPQQPYDPEGKARTGFFTSSNIIFKDEYAYMFLYAENTAGIKSGNCLLRSRKDDLRQWRAFDGKDFTVDLSTADNKTCHVVHGRGISSPFSAVVRREGTGQWIAILHQGRKGEEEGIYYSVSDDLFSWSEKRFIFKAESPYRNKGCSNFYAYPSVIDKKSSSPILDTVADTPELLLARFNFESCRRNHSKRNLVSFPLKITGD
ncbi:hypothetical protein [Terrihabitans sp. B22-R8]|uniref:hypothetical protein n=1 Tax=Terrihabitans sp. B22-R8 TaxID=3425128 RepID=UPI00403C0685